MLSPRPLLPSLLLFTVACRTGEVCDAPAGLAAPVRAAATTPEPVPTIAVDERPPLPLEKWREIKQAGEAAARLSGLDERIERCRALVAEHPTHQVDVVVLEALVDALIARGGFDPAELAGHLAALARLKRPSEAPTELVERYHLKHRLPTAAGLAVLELARERLSQDERELVLLGDQPWREVLARRIAHGRARTHVAEARLHLHDGANDRALAAVARGHAETEKLVKDIALVDAAGATRGTLAAGVLEELHVLEAELRHRAGDDAGARAALGRAIGGVADVELRAIDERLRGTLGLDGADRVVRAAAQPAQDFTLKNLQGEAVRLGDYRGKVVLLTFFATWCGPCKQEMPLLQKFARAHRDRGVEVLAISIDSFNMRSQLPPFVAEHHLDMPVLLEQPEQLTGYDYSGVPALYVIDRAGAVVHARTGYDPQLADKLEREIKAIVEREGDGGRALLTIEQAPAGWGVRWQRPVTGDLKVAAIAAPLGDAGGEVGVIGREGLMRWSADGEALAARPVVGWTASLDATDLDGDGKREWIFGTWGDVKVFDHTGALYWEHTGDGSLAVVGHRDLDGDGSQELLLKDGDRVVAMKAVPEPLWTSAPFKQLESVQIDPTGTVVLQSDRELVQLGARGEVTGRGGQVPEGRSLGGRIMTADGPVDLLHGAWDPVPRVDQDLDGDGHEDVVIVTRTGVVVHDAQGRPLLRVRSHDVALKAAIGDLDGRPGAELVLLVEHYGIVVLGAQR